MTEENNSPLKQKGGFAKSSGSRGKGGRNVGDYNVNTSFAVKPAWRKPTSGGFIGTIAAPNPKKPYNIDDKGKVKINTPNDTDPSSKSEDKENAYGAQKGKLPIYREAWDGNKENINKKYKDFFAYETDMMGIKKDDKRDKEREAVRKKVEKEASEKDTDQSAVPFKLKGSPMYRNFGVGGKPKK